MKVFIPISDEMLEQGAIPEDLVAYHPDKLLLSQVKTSASAQSRLSVNREPGPTPSSDATPALSSSTYLAGARLG